MDISHASLVLVLLAFVLPVLYLLLPLPGKRSGGGGDGLRSPPSPAGCLPLLGHLHLLGALPHRALRSVAAAHGPVLRLRLGRVPTVLVSSAAAAEEVLRARDVAFSSRPRSAMAERLLYGRDVAFAPYGEHWRQARRVCVVHLLSAQRVCSFRRVREEEAAALADAVRATGGHAFDLSGLLVAHANAVVSRAAFGDESARGLYGGADGGRALRKVFSDFSQLLGTKPVRDLLPWLGWVETLRGLERKVRRTFEALDGVLDKVIDDHRRRRRESGRQTCDAAGQRDFVDVLLDVNEMDNEAGIQLDPIEIKAIIMDMFVAGSDATSTPMEWAMAELVSHPRHMRRLQDEIRAVVGDAGGRVTEDHIDKLPYLRAVLKETLRLHAPLPLLVPRETVADTEIMGYHVAARTRVVINGWAIGRDTAVWGEAAEEFMPERFLAGGGGAADYKGQGFEMLPFGGGRRGCPGVTFGMATVEMAVASLLYHFDWAAAAANGKGCREEGMSSLDMSETSGISLGIKHGLPLVAKPRFP